MDLLSAVPGLAEVQASCLGDPNIRVAVLDGPVDLSHPCFDGADIRQVSTLVNRPADAGRMSRHGTHVASLIFGQPGSSVPGVAPMCQGIVVPIFRESEDGHLPQLDLARALEQAVVEGAHVINISGGEPSRSGQADPILERALRLCDQNNVLVVAAAGNDGCACVHVPAAVPTALAVGSLGRDGQPLPSSNWGEEYRSHGVLTLGEGITGAIPGGSTRRMTGTSFATPIVSGVAALLLSIQRRAQHEPDPSAVGRAIVESARSCSGDNEDPTRCLAGILDVSAAYHRVFGQSRPNDAGRHVNRSELALTSGQNATAESAAPDGVRAASLDAGSGPDEGGPDIADVSVHGVQAQSGVPEKGGEKTVQDEPAGTPEIAGVPPGPTATTTSQGVQPAVNAAVSESGAHEGVTAAGDDAAPGAVKPAGDCACGGVTQSEDCHCNDAAATAAATAAAVSVAAAVTPSYVYALGSVGFDFGTEARRDTFRQSMPDVVREADGTSVLVAPNPYDVFQLSDYLNSRPSESTKLIWTLNLDLTPIYALEAEVTYPEDVYGTLRDTLAKQAMPEDDPQHVSRLSIPGVLTNRTIRLFSGQLLPIVSVQPRGLYEWNVPTLVGAVVDSVKGRLKKDNATDGGFDEARVSRLVRIFLDKVYFECRNLGMAPSDRAINFAATNAFQFASGILQGIISGEIVPGGDNSLYSLDSIDVVKSPYCRMDSDCWDVLIKWFDPENERRAKSVFQFTIDVSDELPVSLAPAHHYLTT